MIKLKSMRYFILLLVGLLIGCNSPKQPLSISSDFPKQYLLTPFDSIDLEDLGVFDSYNILFKDSVLLFTMMRGEYKVGVYNMRNRTLFNCVKQGQGPNELMVYSDVYTYKNNMHCYTDPNLQKIYQINLDSLHEGCKEIMAFNKDCTSFYETVEMDKTYYIGLDAKGRGRFGIYNKQTKETSYSQTFPDDEAISALSPYQKAALYSGTQFAIHPDGNKFATIFQGVMDIYSFDEGVIKLDKALHYHYPEFIIPGGNGPAIGYKGDDLQYFARVRSDSDYIYVMYTDRTARQFIGDSFDCPYLLVYDWEGNPVQKFKFARKLNTFCKNGNILYGLSREYNPVIIIYKLPEKYCGRD